MSSETTIDDLPDEMLELILSHLDWYDRQSVSQLSERLAQVAFGSGSNTVLNIYSNIEDFQECKRFATINYSVDEVYSALLASQRPYKRVVLWLSRLDNPEMILKILDHFHRSLDTLRLISRYYEVDLSWVDKILQNCPNVSCLHIRDLSLLDGVNHTTQYVLKPMSKLRTLHARYNVLNAIPNCSEVFCNVTSLHVELTPQNPLKNLIQDLSSQMIELTLLYETAVTLPEGVFPCLETLTLKLQRVQFSLPPTIDDFRKMFNRMPKLKALTIEPNCIDGVILPELLIQYQETLEHLEIPLQEEFDDIPGYEDLAVHLDWPPKRLRKPKARLNHLKWLCLWNADVHKIWMTNNFEFLNVWRLRMQQCYLANHDWIHLLGNIFPKLTELELLQDTGERRLELVRLGKMISRHLPSLQRLSVDIRSQALNLNSIMDFCATLTVHELDLRVECLKIDKEFLVECRKQALSIRSLTIRTSTLDTNAYVPLMEAMPRLRRLELELEQVCPNDVKQMLLTKFPLCNVVRKRYQDIFH